MHSACHGGPFAQDRRFVIRKVVCSSELGGRGLSLPTIQASAILYWGYIYIYAQKTILSHSFTPFVPLLRQHYALGIPLPPAISPGRNMSPGKQRSRSAAQQHLYRNTCGSHQRQLHDCAERSHCTDNGCTDHMQKRGHTAILCVCMERGWR